MMGIVRNQRKLRQRENDHLYTQDKMEEEQTKEEVQDGGTSEPSDTESEE